MTVYMLVSPDQYELPMMVCDTAAELARRLGLRCNSVHHAIYQARIHGYKCRYVKVQIPEEDG